MKKHTYRAKNVNTINWADLKQQLTGAAIVFAIDVAKEKQYALLSTEDESVSRLLHWTHPQQTREVVSQLQTLACPVEVVMESTGTYGDALRYQFREAGFEIYQVQTT
jgi:transposase